MQSVLRLLCKNNGWMDASKIIAMAKGRGPYYGRTLRRWIKSFITNTNALPTNAWGSGNTSHLDTEDGLRDKLRTHLQGRGKYVRAQDLVDYLNHDEVKARYNASTSISLKTAQRWMEDLLVTTGPTHPPDSTSMATNRSMWLTTVRTCSFLHGFQRNLNSAFG